MALPVTKPAALGAARIGIMLILAASLLALLAALAFLMLSLGTPQLSLSDLGTVAEGGGTRLARIVVTQIRIPRLFLGLMAGTMLALAGAMMQDAMRNALAGPEMLGVSAGASLVIAVITIFHIPILFALYPWLALAGSALSGSVVLLSMRRLGDPTRLVLAGVAMGSLLYAAIISIVALGDQNDVGLLYLYLLGSLSNRTWDDLFVILPWFAIGVPLAFISARALNLMQLGDEMAEGLGLRVVRMRLLVVILSAALVAAVVAVSGPISFVALVAPHLARRALRSTDSRLVLPLSALLGAVLLLGADVLAKELFDPIELPVGIWTTLIGGPLLVLMLRRELGTGRAHA